MYFLEHKKQNIHIVTDTDSKKNHNIHNKGEHASSSQFKEEPPDRHEINSKKNNLYDISYDNSDGHQIMSDGKYLTTTETSKQIHTFTNMAKQVNLIFY